MINFFKINCYKVSIPLLNIEKEIKENISIPYLVQVLLISQLIYLLKSDYGCLICDFTPILILVLKNIQNKQDIESLEDFSDSLFNSTIDSSLESQNLLEYKDVNGLEYNNKIHNGLDLYFENNFQQILNLSSQEFKEINFISNGQITNFESFKNQAVTTQLFRKFLSNKLNYESHIPHYKYQSFFPEYNNVILNFTYGKFSKNIKKFELQNNNLNFNIKLDAMTVLARNIILLCIIEMMSQKVNIDSYRFTFFNILFFGSQSLMLSAMIPKDIDHVICTIENKSGQYINVEISKDLFILFYGYAFKDIKPGMKSKTIRILGNDSVITIHDIVCKKCEKFIFLPVLHYLFINILTDFFATLDIVLNKIKLSSNVNMFCLRNIITQEIWRMIIISLFHFIKQK